ncbi:MAG: hypothetical protein J6V23_01650 [Bacteroidaceae bacterium]|jgi:hypothetical protein|nr:hypothetical protein [Bacteroidaceae bacterium]MBR4966851.1 hypothetical protein [Bacteroidaceae bacterium]
MSLSRETQEKLQSAITKMANKYISAEESKVTDFHIRVNGENGELTILDDDDNTLARVHIKEWEGEHNEEVYEKELQNELTKMHRQGAFDSLNIVKPYSFVLTDEDGQSIVDLLIIDDDTLILSADLLEGFDEEMNEFLKKLLEE